MQGMNAICILFILGCYIAERSSCRAVYISHSVTLFESLLLEGCDEKGAKVEWTFDNNLLFLDDRLLVGTALDNITLLPNNSVLIEHASIKHGGTYVCVSASKAIVNHDVNVEAPPLVNITSSKMYTASENHIYLQRDHLTSLTCFANGSRPEVNLTLLVDDIVYGTSNITIIHGAGKNETFDTMVTVSIQAVNENGNISCQSNGVRNHSVDGLTLRYTSFVSWEIGPLLCTLNLQSGRWMHRETRKEITDTEYYDAMTWYQTTHGFSDFVMGRTTGGSKAFVWKEPKWP